MTRQFATLLVAGLPFLLLDYGIGHRYRGSAPLSFRRLRRKLLGAEDNFSPHGKSSCDQLPSRVRGSGVGVDPHPRKVVSKTRLHEGAGRRIERLTGSEQHFVDERRRRSAE